MSESIREVPSAIGEYGGHSDTPAGYTVSGPVAELFRNIRPFRPEEGDQCAVTRKISRVTFDPSVIGTVDVLFYDDEGEEMDVGDTEDRWSLSSVYVNRWNPRSLYLRYAAKYHETYFTVDLEECDPDG